MVALENCQEVRQRKPCLLEDPFRPHETLIFCVLLFSEVDANQYASGGFLFHRSERQQDTGFARVFFFLFTRYPPRKWHLWITGVQAQGVSRP